jgi:hypothetical protein
MKASYLKGKVIREDTSSEILAHSLLIQLISVLESTTSTCSIGTSGTCFTTGHADGLNNPSSQCLPDNNMDSSQAAEYCSGFYSAHKELGAQAAQPTSEPAKGTRGTVQQSSGPDWNNICNQVQGYGLLVQSCADLVYPGGTLTQKGQTAVGSIRNGVLLGLGGLYHLT